VLLLSALALAGCRREEIREYTEPKDTPVPQLADNSESQGTPPARPVITWHLPQGWKEGVPNEISFASFRVPGANGAEADVSITRLGNLEGREALLVNMWRSKVGQQEIDAEAALRELHPVEVGGEKGNLFEVSGSGVDGPLKIVTAMVHRPEGSWFYKLSGDAAVVDAQKPTFLEFLKSVRIQERVAASAPTEVSGRFNWSVPGQWKSVPPGEMQVARFAVPEKNQAKAEVFVSVFPNDTGGMLANANRWRKQLGLGPVEETELSKLVAPLDPGSPGAVVMDMTNGGKRLVGAVVPREGAYWFYKLFGDADAVAPQKESFVAFIKSTP
jgi:hypothetical protein